MVKVSKYIPSIYLCPDLANKPAFGQSQKKENEMTTKEKLIVASTAAVGVVGALAILSKLDGNTLNPKKFKKLKESYIAKKKFLAKEVIAIGAGSCIGGLAGGYIIDKDKENRKAKNREALLQMGNITIPILTVDLFVETVCKKAKAVTKAIAGLGGVVIGVYLANFVMNKINDKIFGKEDGRGVKPSDYMAHVDDIVCAANYISKDNQIIHNIGRVIPLALMVAGNEIGRKRTGNNK
jgi:hypothetical protein